MTTTSASSNTEQPALPHRARRPVLVWVILVFYLLAAAGWLVQYGSLLVGGEGTRVDARGHAYTWFDYVESVGFICLKVVAAVMLFRLKRLATTLFLATLALNIVATSYDLFTK